MLFEGEGCGLCARALDILERESPTRLPPPAVAIDGDEELERRYRIDLPVIVIEGEVAFTYAVGADALERAVRRAQAAPRDEGS